MENQGRDGGDVNAPGTISSLDAARWKYKVIDQNGKHGQLGGVLDWNDLLKKGWKVFDENGNLVRDPRLLFMSDLKGAQLEPHRRRRQSGGAVRRLYGGRRGAEQVEGDRQRRQAGPLDGLLDWNDLKKNGWKVTDENGNPVDGNSSRENGTAA